MAAPGSIDDSDLSDPGAVHKAEVLAEAAKRRETTAHLREIAAHRREIAAHQRAIKTHERAAVLFDTEGKPKEAERPASVPIMPVSGCSRP
jgi:hypothetical protein